MKDILTEKQVLTILQSMDDALAKGPWEESNFLRAIGKNLQGIRDALASEIDQNYTNVTIDMQKKKQHLQPKETQKEVFIALYSSEGSQIHAWERIIANLQRQIISRPIYEDEDGVSAFIKSKENKLNEAYVAIYVDSNDILKLSADKVAIDKFGHALMTLKDRAVNLENINRFVHTSGTYQLVRGHLQRAP